jgi:hypothetical protein
MTGNGSKAKIMESHKTSSKNIPSRASRGLEFQSSILRGCTFQNVLVENDQQYYVDVTLHLFHRKLRKFSPGVNWGLDFHVGLILKL